MEWFWLLTGALVFGSIAALIAPRKGFNPAAAFFAGAMLAIITIPYLLMQPDADPEPVAWSPPVTPAAATTLHDLADLHERGAVTDAEYEAKKRELLARM